MIFWSLLTSKLKYLLGGAATAIAALLGVWGYGWSKKREGASEAATEALREDALKREKAREAAYEEKRDVDGVSDSDLVDRLRRRGDDWGSL